MASGKLSRKSRKPEQARRARYKSEGREAANAKRKQARHKNAMAAKELNPPKVPRGMARALRRKASPKHAGKTVAQFLAVSLT